MHAMVVTRCQIHGSEIAIHERLGTLRVAPQQLGYVVSVSLGLKNTITPFGNDLVQTQKRLAMAEWTSSFFTIL